MNHGSTMCNMKRVTNPTLSNDPAVPLSFTKCLSSFQWTLFNASVSYTVANRLNSPTNRMSTKKAPSSRGLACGRSCSLINTFWRISNTSCFTMLTLGCRSHTEIWKQMPQVLLSGRQTGLYRACAATPKGNKTIQWMDICLTFWWKDALKV